MISLITSSTMDPCNLNSIADVHLSSLVVGVDIELSKNSTLASLLHNPIVKPWKQIPLIWQITLMPRYWHFNKKYLNKYLVLYFWILFIFCWLSNLSCLYRLSQFVIFLSTFPYLWHGGCQDTICPLATVLIYVKFNLKMLSVAQRLDYFSDKMINKN